MTKKELARNVWLYRLHIIFSEPLFWGPVLITCLQKLGHMQLPDIYYMESVVLVICLLMDIPSGALADAIGRKKTIIIGRVFLTSSIAMFATMTNPFQAWFANILWAIGYSMQSGADSALFYDTIKAQGEESSFRKAEGRNVGARMLLVALCSLVTGYIASINLRLPALLSIPTTLIPLVASFYLTEPARTEKYSASKQVAILKSTMTHIRNSKEIRWMIVFAALLATTSKIWFFMYNPYFEAVNLPVAEYGVIFFLLNVVAWIASHFAHRTEDYLGEKNFILLLVICLGVPIMLMGLVPIRPFAYLVLVQNVVRGSMGPFVGDFLNKHVDSGIRATTLSARSSIANLTSILGLAIFGWLNEYTTLLHSLTILGAVFVFLGWMSYKSYVKKIA